MSAGELRERVALEYRAVIDDGYGNPVAGPWTESFRIAARIQPLRGGESIMAARLEGRQPFVLKIRNCAAARAITTDWRAHNLRTTQIYEIRTTANMDEHRQYIDLLCEYIGQIEAFAASAFSLDFSSADNSGYLALLEDI